jgi:uncharacterized protein (TIGR04255 family)
MGKKLANAPIFYILGQIRFSPILRMADFVPKIHERLRRDYPEVRQEELRRIQMNLAAPESNDVVSSLAAPRWIFSDLRKNAGYVLYTDSIVFHTSAYETSAEFLSALIRGVQIVDETVGLSYVDGVGVRTLDAIVPEHGRSLDFYLNRQVLGLHGLLDGEFRQNMTENVTQFPSGQQVSRIVILKGVLGVPFDLFPITLTLGQKFLELNGLHAVVDLDHNRQERFEFDVDEIAGRLSQVKNGVTEVFKKIVTPEALIAWDSN